MFAQTRYAVLLLLILFRSTVSIAMEIQEVRVSIGEEQVEKQEVNVCCLVRLWDQARNGSVAAWERLGRLLEELGSPKGIVITTCAYAVLSGISNFLWAFNWKAHAGLSENTASTIQEIGGLSASAENFILGALLPLILYEYNKWSKKQAGEPEPEARRND